MDEAKENLLIPVILSGGSGSRLWPLSRESYPKQFWPLDSSSKLSLLQQTIRRLRPLDNIADPIIVCNEEHRFLVAEQCREIDIKPQNIILEPIGKNTAPAIILSALDALKKDQNSRLIVLSSDHIILNELQFFEAINYGLKFIDNNKIVTFGVVPNRPEIGYGYIEVDEKIDILNLKGQIIQSFIEKPTLARAKDFLKQERFFWNSGMFMFKTSLILHEFSKHSPKSFEMLSKAYSDGTKDLDFFRVEKKYFDRCEDISIDKAVMEKTDLGIVIPIDKGWSDVGSWYSLWNCSDKDSNNNYIKGNVYSEKSTNNYIRSEKRLIVTLGINNTVIVETDDAVLISNIENTQEIKNVVKKLKDKGSPESSIHNLVYRPWGSYQSMLKGDRWQVKLIKVKPTASLSLQMHHHRAEHWIIVKGTAKVELDEEIKLLSENQSIHIPVGSKHRLSNPGKLTLEMIEVQSGPYLDEDDIIRFNDKYGRK